MAKINVLIFPAGEINSLELHDALATCVNINVFGASSIDRHGSYVFENYTSGLPMITATDFYDKFNELLAKWNIDVVFPTHDTVATVFADNADKINAKIIAADKETSAICRDKEKTYKALAECDFVPQTFDKIEKYPVFIKPLDGSSSINAFKVNTAKQLDFFRSYVPNPIVQEMIIGEEFTVDVFCDFNSTPITIVPRRRLAVRSGEILKGKTTRDYAIIKASIDLVEKLKPFGHITLQCIKNDTGIYFIEINPRFGGGAPMSIVAGANSIENLIKLKKGEKLSYNEDWKDNIIFSRFDNSVII